MRHLRALLRLVALVLLLLLFVLLGVFTYTLARRRAHPWLLRAILRGMLWVGGVRVLVEGEVPQHPRGTLFVANHCSYIDIPIYGSMVPVRFTPKAEIKRWPLIGLCSTLAMSLFIRRERDAAAGQRAQIRAALEAGDNVILFPEGTTNDGEHIKPFKSALFSAVEPAEGAPQLPVRMMALAYTRIEGRPPASGRMLDRVAWYGDMTLLPHLWALLSMRRVEATLRFIPTPTLDFSDRKQAARHCEEMVATAVSTMLAE
jgi:lyso-ornithine lipid O-acyltransferase